MTFTNKAAEEMRARVVSLLGADCSRVWVSTFHALCARLLRREAPAIGLSRDFVIYDSSDQLSVVKQALKELHIDESFVQPRAALSRISHAKNKMESPDVMAAAAAGWSRRDEQVSRVYTYYLNALRDANAVDFDDLLLKNGRPLRDNPNSVRSKYAEQFRFVMVDEYQDTNRPQYLLIRRLAEVHRNLCVVGDPDQSIYKWRGADLRNILDFEQDFRRRSHRETRTELSIDADHPRRCLCGYQPEPQPQGQASLDATARAARAIVYFRGGDESGGGGFHHTNGENRSCRGRGCDGCGAVPHKRPIAHDRGRADARRPQLQDHRWRAFLRAQGDQGCLGIYAPRHQPARRCQPAACDQRAGQGYRKGRYGGRGAVQERGRQFRRS